MQLGLSLNPDERFAHKNLMGASVTNMNDLNLLKLMQHFRYDIKFICRLSISSAKLGYLSAKLMLHCSIKYAIHAF